MTIDSATRGFFAILALGHSSQVQGQGTVPPREHLAIVHATIYTMTDSGNTRRIALVVSDGRVYSPKARTALFEQALRAAGSSNAKKP